MQAWRTPGLRPGSKSNSNGIHTVYMQRDLPFVDAYTQIMDQAGVQHATAVGTMLRPKTIKTITYPHCSSCGKMKHLAKHLFSPESELR